MPELPEVESVRRGLLNTIIGKTITQVSVLWPRIIQTPNVEEFKTILVNQTIYDIKRRGKFLLFYLDDYVIISHLRMEGKYFYKDANEELEKHTHIIFDFDDSKQLRYNDVRKFGRMAVVNKGLETINKSLIKLGPEPIEKELKIEQMAFFLQNKTKAIKTILLDQSMVAGIGNIYADEILYHAKINPKRSGNSLSDDELNELRSSIIYIMNKAIEYGGSTIRTYHNMLGEDGTYQQFHQVYGKQNEACRRCTTSIEKIQLNGRGTHYCPYCQPERSTK